MKSLLTIIFLLSMTVGFGQTVMYGQEMSETYKDELGNYSIALLEYNIKGATIRDGDKIYHNELVELDSYGFPYDDNYFIQEVKPHVYEIIGKEH